MQIFIDWGYYYLFLYVILPLVRSQADNSHTTESPTSILTINDNNDNGDDDSNDDDDDGDDDDGNGDDNVTYPSFFLFSPIWLPAPPASMARSPP